MKTISRTELFNITHKDLMIRLAKEGQIIVTATKVKFAVVAELQPRQRRGVKIKEYTYHEAVRHIDLIGLMQEGKTIVKIKPDTRKEGTGIFYISEF